MYSHCLVCNADLGTNEAIEHFPVGRRLAFDAAKGLLWVVCRKCERWNLTPLEERWEAIDECERLFRDVRTRVSTDNIGLARLAGGTEIVRIGKPLRPELAAWRYGDQFGRRQKRLLVRGGIVGAALAGGVVAAPLLGAPVAVLGVLGLVAFQAALVGTIVGSSGAFLKARWICDDQGKYLLVPGDAVANIRIAQPATGDWELRIPYGARLDRPIRWHGEMNLADLWKLGRNVAPVAEAHVSGEAALTVARQLLPRINGFGANRAIIRDSVSMLSELGTGAAAFRAAAARTREFGARQATGDTGALAHLPGEVRLALEMAAFEDQERLALEGELAGLERAWREAEELAGIADRLLEPPAVTDALDRIKAKASDTTARNR